MKKILKWAKRVAIGSCIYLSAAIPSRSLYLEDAAKKSDQEVLEYVKDNLEKRMEKIEEELNIKFHGKPVGIYELTSEDKNKDYLGLYDKKNDKIYLHTGIARIPGWNLNGIGAVIISLGFIDDVNPALDHELGHFYTDKLSENMGLGDWPNFSSFPFMERSTSIKLISEGIAEYISMKMNDEEDEFEDAEWPEDFDEYFYNFPFENIHLIYKGGSHLVKPIIDKYGEQGIKYMMFNIPKPEELVDLPSYQQRILQELENNPGKLFE